MSSASNPREPRTETTLTPAAGVWLVTSREVTSRVRSRAFLLGTLALIVLIGGYVLFMSFLGNNTSRSTVGLTVPNVHVAEPLRAVTQARGLDVQTREVANVAAGERMVRDGELDGLVTGSIDHLEVVVKQDPDEKLLSALNAVVQQQMLDTQLTQAGLDPNTVHRTVADTHVAVRSLLPTDPSRHERLILGLLCLFMLFYSLQTFGTTVAQGVVEEKSSRVVELLLSTVRPWQLLLGKVLGVAVASTLQLAVLGVLGIIGTTVSGQLTIPVTAAGILLAGLGWYVVGFLLIGIALAAAASLVSRQEDLGSVIAPVSMVIVVPFLLGFNLLLRNPDDQLVQVLSLIPPFGPILMPSRIALGDAPAWQVGLSLLLTLAVLAVLVWLGGRIYTNAILRFGSRVKLREALRAA